MVKHHLSHHGEIIEEITALNKDNFETSDQSWHLAKSDVEAKLSEFEFLLWRLFYSFSKWQEDCQRCVSDDDVAAEDIALMHLIRVRESPKTISEIARLLNRDDMSNLQYSLKKLLRLKIIKKYKHTSKKSIVYEITEKGIKITDKYGEIRRNVLIKMLKSENDQDWENLYEALTAYKNRYDNASRTVALLKTKDKDAGFK
jgi:predicted MarR family transcription regulator